MTPTEKYRKLTDIEHVLLRPGMYVGSTKARDEELYLPDPDSGLLVPKKVSYNPAFLKIFDEIVSNSVDEHRRNPKLTEIRVKVDAVRGSIQVWDNGGIPVVKHTEHDEWVPEMIFSNMKAGSNFNDEEERLVAGTNGVGSTLTNIFSLEFKVRTSDGRKKFEQVFRKNMTARDEPSITGPYGKFTEITFTPDLARFGLTSIDETHVRLMRMRCVDLAACNPQLKIVFDGTPYQYPTFRQYCQLYAPTKETEILYEETARWKVALLPSRGSFNQVSFVNSTTTTDGGTHVDHVMGQILDDVRARVKKKHKIDLLPGQIKNQFFIVLQADIVNPGFSSQTKEKLITEVREFGSRFTPSEKLLTAVFKSEITLKVLDWAQQKADADERRQLRELNKNLSRDKVLKLIDAKATSGRVRCTLALFEGDCLREDTPAVVFREGSGPLQIPIREVREGDFVITHMNTLKRVTAVSRKVARLFCIRTSQGELWASGKHRLQVYTPLTDEFSFLRVDEIVPGTHRLVRNRIALSRMFSPLYSVSQDALGSVLLETSQGLLVSSNTHQFATLALTTGTFGLTPAPDLVVGEHVIVFTVVDDPPTVEGL